MHIRRKLLMHGNISEIEDSSNYKLDHSLLRSTRKRIQFNSIRDFRKFESLRSRLTGSREDSRWKIRATRRATAS